VKKGTNTSGRNSGRGVVELRKEKGNLKTEERKALDTGKIRGHSDAVKKLSGGSKCEKQSRWDLGWISENTLEKSPGENQETKGSGGGKKEISFMWKVPQGGEINQRALGEKTSSTHSK